MKKYFLGAIIVGIFILYSFVLRNQHSEPVVAPLPISRSNSSKNSNTTNSDTGSSTSTPVATTPPPSTTTPVAQYKDGTYTGSVADAFYGNVQVSAYISGGKLTSVDFLQYPNENPNSISINSQAIPYLKQEAISAQSSKVSIVTGATYTSQAFIQSLANALNQAKQS